MFFIYYNVVFFVCGIIIFFLSLTVLLVLFTQMFIFLIFFFCRWRNSFLWSLIFGVPALSIMIYFMFASPPDDHSNQGNMTENMTTTTAKPKSSHSYQIMLLPGLSLDNLLMFLLASPVQVN